MSYWWGNDLLQSFEDATPSSIVDGHLVHGKRIPVKGNNFKSYSTFLSLIGRTHVHDRVRDVVIHAYNLLKERFPDTIFVFGETGWKNGGNFWPHKTHRQGLSVDFMVPVVDCKTHQPAIFPTYPWTWFGYKIRFDHNGRHQSYQIDFKVMAEHLAALQEACGHYALRIKRVILDPPLQDRLKEQENSFKIATIPFMKGKAWFPHDGHYHVDFELVDLS